MQLTPFVIIGVWLNNLSLYPQAISNLISINFSCIFIGVTTTNNDQNENEQGLAQTYRVKSEQNNNNVPFRRTRHRMALGSTNMA